MFTAFSVAVALLTLIPQSAQAVQSSETVVVNPDPADWTPQILDGQVNAILQMGSKVVVGGTFTQVRRAGFLETFTRNYLFSFDMETGVIDPNFIPVLDASVEELTPGPDGTSVFVGGDFGSVNGLSYKKVVRLNLADGSVVTSFKANANRLVQDVVFRNGWLYVSGKFDQIKSVARSGVARLNPNTGAVDPNFDVPFTTPLRGTLGVPEIDVSPDGSKLMALGSFSQVGGLPRVQIAQLDLTTTPVSVSSWQTSLYPVYEANGTTTWCSSSFSTYMRDLDISPDGSYFVVVTTGAFRANRLCDSISRFELTSTGPNQAPDVDELDRWRHDVERQCQRKRRVHRRAHALGQQPVPRRRRWARCCSSRGDRGAVPAQRHPLQLEPRARARGRELHPARHTRRPVGGQRHGPCRQRVPPEDRLLPGRRGRDPPAGRDVLVAQRPLQHGPGRGRRAQPPELRPDDARVGDRPFRSASTGGTRAARSWSTATSTTG